ncbi:3-hydroxyacyl-CoA dehydrogenase family protein [Crossiella sp. CA-258035]|uniref:3-hydroxyacyl-CoA dehydrogenase family protein n=1 Tax=Crossiella sp. CA-258035 TaxID=2981138 RepID=UPI0024BD018C|nr:3-hydroxyacyl-CoA dehydrogenase family protein [Crossiella sp. CA-258035]WHT21867.1 3-hydroxyacyl-CoA dehydrogenase family protein [Crossiella sp. CA-258035]
MARFGIIGAGLMGHGIAVALARGGHQVHVHDSDPATLDSLPVRIGTALRLCGESEEASQRARSLITATPRLAEALGQAEFVIEAVPERLAVKHEVIAAVEAAVSPEVPVWSNTSVLSLTEVGSVMRHPGRLVGVHWWNPPHLIPLVELAPSAATEPELVSQAEELLGALGKTTVRLHRDVPGFIGNRLQFALLREALNLVRDNVCDAATIDTVVRSSFGLRLASVGPMENADYIGLDLTRSILTSLAPSLSTAAGPFPGLDELLGDGHRGMASGEGLLSWPPGRGEDVARRLVAGIQRNLGSGT